jgi:hypothetical protein
VNPQKPIRPLGRCVFEAPSPGTRSSSIELDSYGFIIIRPEWGIVRGLVDETQAKVLLVAMA